MNITRIWFDADMVDFGYEYSFEPEEKGSGEWGATRAVRGDRVSARRTVQPRFRVFLQIARFINRFVTLRGAG